jgi:uncharacterized membrane protein YphA (DoxX/SURF4 family)
VSHDPLDPIAPSAPENTAEPARVIPSPTLPVVDLTASALRGPAPVAEVVPPPETPVAPPRVDTATALNWTPIEPGVIHAASPSPVTAPVELTEPPGALVASSPYAPPVEPVEQPVAFVAPSLDDPAVAQTSVIAESSAAEARTARARALGEVAPTPDVVTAPLRAHLPTTYNKFPSLALLLLRLAVAALMGIRAFRDADALTATTTLWRNTILPNPEVLAWTQVAIEGAIALLLLFGLGTRVVGFLLMVLAVAWLTFVLWGAVSPFQTGMPGFTGEFEVLLVTVGFAFLALGGGGWLSLDAFFHRARVERKNAKGA